MDEETLTALKGSMDKWVDIIRNDGEDLGHKNRPLCELYYTDESCEDACPVKSSGGDDFCRYTPYDDWVDHHDDEHTYEDKYKAHCPKCIKLAKKELKFLTSLLPKDDNPRTKGTSKDLSLPPSQKDKKVK